MLIFIFGFVLQCSGIVRRVETQITETVSKLHSAPRKINGSQEYKNTQSLEESIPKHTIVWKNSDEFFETQYKTCIEEFDEESPNSKNNSFSSGTSSESAISQGNLTQKVEQITKSPAVLKFHRSDVKNLSHDFQSCFQTVKTYKEESSEESSCEPDIQESSQESVQSAVIQIECSTSSNTKSTEVGSFKYTT